MAACRYVYLPLEGGSHYLVLVTSKASNIIDDLDTLRLLAKAVPDQCQASAGRSPPCGCAAATSPLPLLLPPQGQPLTEEVVSARAFEIIFAFDEIVAASGYREEVTLHQVRTCLEMESHEEKLALMIKANKMAEAKEAAKHKEREIRERHREEDKSSRAAGGGSGGGGPSGGSSSGRYGGISSGSGSGSGYGGGSGSGGGSGGGYSSPSVAASSAPEPAPAARKAGGGAGMQLGAGRKPGGGGAAAASSLAGVMAEEGIREKDVLGGGGAGSSAAAAGGGVAAAVTAAASAAAAAAADQATVAIEEHLSVRLTRDGGGEGVEVKGVLTLTVQDEASSRVKVLLHRGDVAAFAFTTHPNIAKPLFVSDGIIALKQADRPFPVGTALGVLRWRAQTADESAVPLSVTCWPEEMGNGTVNVTVEFTLNNDALHLADVVITVPLGSDATPRVVACGAGTTKHNTRENALTWLVDSIAAGASSNAVLEFSVKGKSADAFFPVNVAFVGADCAICAVDVEDVVALDDGRSLRYSVAKSLVVDQYVIE